LPCDASDVSCDIAEKSFVNELGEMLGVEVDVLVEVAALLVDLELEDDELPHAAISAPTPTASTAVRIQ
jgi:hypothetical protein